MLTAPSRATFHWVAKRRVFDSVASLVTCHLLSPVAGGGTRTSKRRSIWWLVCRNRGWCSSQPCLGSGSADRGRMWWCGSFFFSANLTYQVRAGVPVHSFNSTRVTYYVFALNETSILATARAVFFWHSNFLFSSHLYSKVRTVLKTALWTVVLVVRSLLLRLCCSHLTTSTSWSRGFVLCPCPKLSCTYRRCGLSRAVGSCF